MKEGRSTLRWFLAEGDSVAHLGTFLPEAAGMSICGKIFVRCRHAPRSGTDRCDRCEGRAREEELKVE